MVESVSSGTSDVEDASLPTPTIAVISAGMEHPAGVGQDAAIPEEERVTGCGDTACCNPRKPMYRFIALFFMCFLGFGSYFCFDTPGSLQDHIKEDMKVDTVQFASLYSLYSWPNVVLCFIGGFLIDRVFGIRWGTIIFSSIVTGGQFVYALGGLVNQFWVMQIGRFIFGVGGESLAVAQNTYTVSWFKGKELNTVFGLQLSMARVGSTVNFLSMVPLYNWVQTYADGYEALGLSLMFAGITCVFSLACAFILGFLDKRRSEVLHTDSTQSGEKVQLSDIFTFPLSFWLMSVICVAYYVAIFPFIGLAKVFFMHKYDLNDTTANSVSSVVYIISAIASPVLGNMVDHTGRNVLWVFLAVVVTLACHAMITFTFWNPFIPMSILGLAYSLLASALWPMVALIIPEHKLGTAYGIMQSVQNLGLAVVSILAGLIVDKSGYMMLQMFYMVWVCVALISTVIIWLSDSATGGILNLSVSDRQKKDEDTECLLDT